MPSSAKSIAPSFESSLKGGDKMKRIELPFLKFYEEKLELKWKIAYFLTEGEITARIFFRPSL
jgi:hypothetical protein